MTRSCFGWLLTAVTLSGAVVSFAADEKNDELILMVVNLLADKDKELRAVGLEQVRSEVKGAAATKQFADQLPKLSVEAQIGLLSALADRGDTSARGAIFERLTNSQDESVRAAAIGALGKLGSTDEDTFIKLLSRESKAETAAARSSLIRLQSSSSNGAIVSAMPSASPRVRAILLEILAERQALEACPEIAAAAADSNREVRTAAMTALGQIASPEQIPGMLQGILKAEGGPEREAAEKAVAQVCSRIENTDLRAEPILAALTKLGETEQIAILPTVGRVGGAKALTSIEAAIGDQKTARREAGLRALANWPDASVADKLLILAEAAGNSQERGLMFQAFVRVSSLRGDKRTDQDRLDRMKQAMRSAKTDEERSLAINRCRTAYIVESLRYVLPYLDQPQFSQLACETIVELAHHRELREPNKAEFDQALDKVMAITKDPVVTERAQRYKKGQTWERPKAPANP